MDALDEDAFLSLLTKLIGETRFLQNRPPEFLPEEDRAGRHVVDVLSRYAGESGQIRIRRVHYAEGRGNIIVEIPGSGPGVVSFVGSHLDGAGLPASCLLASRPRRSRAREPRILGARPVHAHSRR